MSDDLERRLAALLDELPGPTAGTRRAARASLAVAARPRWRRALGPAAGIAAAAGVAGLLIVAVPGGDPGPAPGVTETGPAGTPAGWRSVRDPARGFAVAVPPGWRRSPRVLAPGVSDPHEILSLGTGPLPVAGRSCAHIPGRAAAAAAPAGAFVSVQERAAGAGAGRGLPARPSGFAVAGAGGVRGFACVGDAGVRVWWVPFSDAGRAFHLLVAVGDRAPARVRDEARRVADSLRFDPGTTVGGGPWLRLPAGWSASETSFPMAGGRATMLRVGTGPVPDAGRDVSGDRANAALGPEDVLVDVLLRPVLPGRQEPALPGRPPVRFTAAGIPRRAYTGQTARVVARREVRLGGRVVQVRVALGPAIDPPRAGARQDLPADLDARLARANAVLATLVLPPRR